MNTILPSITSQSEYRRIKADSVIRERAIEAICRHHELEHLPRAMFSNGSTIVYALGDQLVLKLYSPLFPHDLATERLVLEHLHGKLNIATPGVHHHGDQNGWPYLIMDCLSGTPMVEVWDRISQEDRVRLCRETGELMAQVHALPISGLEALDQSWNRFLEDRQAVMVEHHSSKETPSPWLERIMPYLQTVVWLPARANVLLHTEFMRDHLLVSKETGTWQLTGLIDFEPAFTGYPEYDMASVVLFVTAGEPGLLRAFLEGYGYGEHQMDEHLRRRLMGMILIHIQSNLPWYFGFMPASESAKDFEDLARSWIDF